MRTKFYIAMACLFLAGLLWISYDPIENGLVPGSTSISPAPPPPATSTRVLRFASDPWPPYAGNAASERKGYIVDLLNAAFTPLGYRVEFVNLPWSRCIEDVRAGNLTGLAGADIDEVKDFVFPRTPVGLTRPRFFTRADSTWTFTGIDSLSSIRLGYIQDYTYEPQLDKYLSEHKGTERVLSVTGTDCLRRLLEALRAGHIDALVENAPVVHWTLKEMQHPVSEFREAGSPRQGVRLYVPFSPALGTSPELAKILDRRLQELRDDGTFLRIIASYGIEDWAGTNPAPTAIAPKPTEEPRP